MRLNVWSVHRKRLKLRMRRRLLAVLLTEFYGYQATKYVVLEMPLTHFRLDYYQGLKFWFLEFLTYLLSRILMALRRTVIHSISSSNWKTCKDDPDIIVREFSLYPEWSVFYLYNLYHVCQFAVKELLEQKSHFTHLIWNDAKCRHQDCLII